MIQRTLGSRNLMLVRKPIEGSLERDLQRVMKHLRIETLLDVGAHEGNYARMWRSIGYDREIISFEPAPRAFATLAQKHDPRWAAHRIALGDASGSARFYEYAEHTEFASMHLPSGKELMPTLTQSKSYNVEVRTVDDFIAEQLIEPESCFLKVDTQGHDQAVLLGAKANIGKLAALQVEVPMFGLYQGAPTAEELLMEVRGAGFDLVGMYPVHAHPRPLVPIEFDALFVRCGSRPG